MQTRKIDAVVIGDNDKVSKFLYSVGNTERAGAEIKTVEIDNVKINLFDIRGQERFGTIGNRMIESANSIIFVGATLEQKNKYTALKNSTCMAVDFNNDINNINETECMNCLSIVLKNHPLAMELKNQIYIRQMKKDMPETIQKMKLIIGASYDKRLKQPSIFSFIQKELIFQIGLTLFNSVKEDKEPKAIMDNQPKEKCYIQ